MKKAKKFLAVCLSAVTMFVMFSFSASAADLKLEVASVLFDYYIGGVAVEDYEDYITVETDGFEFLESEDIPVIEAYDYTGKKITEYKNGERCEVVLRMQASDGYYLTTGWFSVNGIFSDDKIINTVGENGEEITYLEMWFSVTIGVPDSVNGYKRIEDLSLYVKPDSDYNVSDWEKYILVDNLSLEIAHHGTESPVRAYDADNVDAGPLDNSDYFKAGEEYLIYIDVVSDRFSRLPIPGFKSLKVNNVETSDYTFGSYRNVFDSDVSCVTVRARVKALDSDYKINYASVNFEMRPGVKISDLYDVATVYPEGADVKLIEIYSSKDMFNAPLADNEVIELGYEYLVYVDLVAEDGYYFPLDDMQSMKIDGEDSPYASTYYIEGDEGELVECVYGERYYDFRPFGKLIDFFTYITNGIIDIFAIIRGLILLMFI